MDIFTRDGYIFKFETGCSKEKKESICDLIQGRIALISDILGIPIYPYIKKTTYIIKECEFKRGYFGDSMIICETNDIANTIEPFVHEECHDIAYRKWGLLPCFLFEGLSEYVQYIIKFGKAECMDFYYFDLNEATKELIKKSENILHNTDKHKIPFARQFYFYKAGQSFICYLYKVLGNEYVDMFLSYFYHDYEIYKKNAEKYFKEWIDNL